MWTAKHCSVLFSSVLHQPERFLHVYCIGSSKYLLLRLPEVRLLRRYYSIVNTVSGINRWIASIVRRVHIVNLCEKIRQWKTEFKKTVPSYSSIPLQLVNTIYEWSVRRFHTQRSSSQAQVSYNIEQTDHIYKERPLNTVTWRISVSHCRASRIS